MSQEESGSLNQDRCSGNGKQGTVSRGSRTELANGQQGVGQRSREQAPMGLRVESEEAPGFWSCGWKCYPLRWGNWEKRGTWDEN